MPDIKKPDANPVVALVLTWWVFNLGHLIVNGQQRKWMYSLIAIIIGSFLCVIPGLIIQIFSIIDAYQTAERLKNGERTDERYGNRDERNHRRAPRLEEEDNDHDHEDCSLEDGLLNFPH